MLWACLLLPHLALDAVLRRQPHPEHPLALIGGIAPRRVLVAVNDAARRAGLQRGQSLSAAQALLADFTAIDHDPAWNARGRDFLAAWAYRYSSQVSTAFTDAVLLEIEGSLGLFGPWPALETRLRAELTVLGFRHRLALAPNARAAWVLAGHQDGLAITSPELTRRALQSVPLTRARLGHDTVAALERMGVRTLGKLATLPRASLGKRFGPGLLDQLDQLFGDAPEVLTFYRPPDVFDARLEFDHGIESSQALLFPLRRLTTDLAAYLSGRDGGVQRFVLRFAHEDRADSELPVGLLAPERDPARLFELASGRLLQTTVAAPVVGLRLLARELPPFVPAHRELFDPRPQQSLPWEQLRERLRARLGDGSVQRLAQVADHRPERAWRALVDDADDTPRRVPAPRPSWLLARPIPLRDTRLHILAGPERIETGWWDGGDVRRDYYLVETALGQRAWAFCAAGEVGPFMLHGWFA